MNNALEEGNKLSSEVVDAYCLVLAVSGGHLPRPGPQSPCLPRTALPTPLKTVLDNWNANTMADFPAAHAWVRYREISSKFEMGKYTVLYTFEEISIYETEVN